MNNIIDLFNTKTYPQIFIKIIHSNNELDFYKIDQLLSDYYIKCAHITRIYDKGTIEQYGILRPFVIDDSEQCKYHISYKLKKFVFEPYKKYFPKVKLDSMMKEYDENLIKEYNDNKNCFLEDYFGKYSVISFSYDNVDRITVDDFNGYKNFLLYQGGELIDWNISNLVKFDTKSYVVFFKVKISELPKQVRSELYDHMIRVYFGKELIVYPSAYVNKDIPPEDLLLPLKELVVSE